MDYKFSLTARLVAVGACALAALMALLFALGIVVGHRWSGPSLVAGESPVATVEKLAEEPEPVPAAPPDTPAAGKP